MESSSLTESAPRPAATSTMAEASTDIPPTVRANLEKARAGAPPPVISFFHATSHLSPKTGAISPVRFEKKWVLEGFSLAEVVAMIHRHPAAFRVAYPPRQVNNIYFDSPNLDYYFAHVVGATQRLKVRVRWYGEFQVMTPKPVVEFKIKRGSVGWKESFPVPAILAQSLLGQIDPPVTRDGEMWPEPVRPHMHSLGPTLGNQYWRHYFCSAASGVRLTIDYQLGFHGRHGPDRGWRPLAYYGPALIMELKYHEDQARAAAAIAGGFPFRLSRCSKYVLGIQHQ
jgi:hypothetical protein